MKKLTLTAIAAALALSCGAVAAGDKADKPMADKQTHGQAVSGVAQSDTLTTETRGEAVSTMAHSDRDFKKLDADSDGFLSSAELNADPDLTTQFNDWDDDADTKLSQSEYDAYIASTVTDADDAEEEAE